MKENFLEVLLFIFEHFTANDLDVEEPENHLVSTLEECGFSSNEVDKALIWLDELALLREQNYSPKANITNAYRIYPPYEAEKLDVDCRGFIHFLEQMGVLDCQTRELIIDRAIALEGDEVNFEQLKWVVMMVLYNMPDKESEYVWIENMGLEHQLH